MRQTIFYGRKNYSEVGGKIFGMYNVCAKISRGRQTPKIATPLNVIRADFICNFFTSCNLYDPYLTYKILQPTKYYRLSFCSQKFLNLKLAALVVRTTVNNNIAWNAQTITYKEKRHVHNLL